MSVESAGFLRRAAAYLIDIALLYVYIIVLFFASTAVDSVLPFHDLMAESYALRHGISFSTLTLPLVLYFILMERSGRQGTLGKAQMKLHVTDGSGDRASTRSVVIRNLVKFLPWEIAHTHIHINPEFITAGRTTVAGWVFGVGLPIAAMVVYAAMIATRSDGRSLYELMSGTRTVRVSGEVTPPVR